MTRRSAWSACAAWVMAVTLTPSCGLLADLGDDPALRDASVAPDTTSADAVDGSGAEANGETPDVSAPSSPNLFAYDGTAGRGQLFTLHPSGRLDAAPPFSFDPDLMDLVELTPKTLAGYSAKTGKLSTVALDSVGVVGRDDATYAGYEHLAALNATTVMLYRSTSTVAHYQVLQREGTGWKSLLERDETAREFLELNRFARTRTDKLMFRTTSGGTGYLAVWTGSTLDGRWISGGSAGWTDIVPMVGPTLFYYSSQPGAAVEGTGALERIYPDNTSSVVVYWRREDFPWKAASWTSVVGTSRLLMFYRRSDGASQAVTLEVDPELVLRPAPVTVTPGPGPGFTRWVSLE